MADGKVTVEVEFETEKSTKQAEKDARKSGNKAGKKFGTGFESGLGGLKSTLLGLGAALATAFAGRRILEAAAAQEDAVNALNTALRRSGEFSVEASNGIQAWASELQASTTAGDEAILANFALSKSYGATADQAKIATEAALELSEAAGISFEESVRRVGRAMSGSVDDVSKFAPAIKDLTKAQLAAGGAAEALIASLGGTAAAAVNTFSGSLAQANNTFGDFLEQIGFIVTKSPAVISVFKFISKEISEAAGSLKEFGESGDVLKPIILNAIEVGRAINMFVVRPFEFLVRAVNVAVAGVELALQGIVTAAAGAASKLTQVFAAIGIGEASKNLEALSETTGEVFDDMSVKAQEATGNLFNQEFSNQSEEFLARLAETVAIAAPLTEELGGAFSQRDTEKVVADNDALSLSFEKLASSIQAQAKLINVTNKQIATSFIKGLAGGIGKAFNNVGSALANGENAFKAFGDSVLGIFGNLLSDMGQGFILQGTARILAGDPGGGALIGAGAAMQIFGGLIGAKSGGAVGASGGGASVTTGGGVAAAPSAAVVQDETETGPQTQIAVNIQGDVLDSDESGSRIVDLINNAFDKEGAIISNNARFA